MAELIATLSLAADLGMGRPMDRVLRQTVVAMRLGAAAGTDRAACSSHLEHVYAKLGVRTRTEAALFAMRHGMIATAGEPEPDKKIG